VYARPIRTIPVVLIAFVLGACASVRTLDFRIETRNGEPIVGALVNATPLGVSPSPLPVSFENLKQAGANRGTGGVSDRAGALRLTLESAYEYELRVQPAPMSAESLNGDAWLWTLAADGATLRPRAGRTGEAHRPVLVLVR